MPLIHFHYRLDSQYLSLYNKQYYLRKLNAYGSKINICQAASWSFNMQLIVYRGFSSTPNRMPHSLLIFLYKRGALIIDHGQVWYEGWSPWTKRIFLLFNNVHVVFKKHVWMYKHTNVLNMAPLTSDFIFVHNYIILCDDWFLDYIMIH